MVRQARAQLGFCIGRFRDRICPVSGLNIDLDEI